MTTPLDPESVKFALKHVVEDLDYDLYKSIENPEDPDDDDNTTWDELAQTFIFGYEEDQEFKNDHS